MHDVLIPPALLHDHRSVFHKGDKCWVNTVCHETEEETIQPALVVDIRACPVHQAGITEPHTVNPCLG